MAIVSSQEPDNQKRDNQTHFDRVSVLERRLRMHSAFSILLGSILLSVFLLGAGPGKFEEIHASRFVVSDESNQPRALLTSNRGATVLSLFDAENRVRARLAVKEDGHPELTLLSDAGSTLVRLAERQGAVLLQMDDGRGMGQIVLGQTDEQFGINVSPSDGQTGVRLRAADDTPQLAIIGPEGSGVFQAFSHTNKAGLSISDKTGVPSAILVSQDQFRPMLLLQGQQKRTIVVPQENIAGAIPANPTR